MIGLAIGTIVATAAMFYAYFLFPLLMATLGSRRPHSPENPDFQPLVSLIVPAHNESEVIQQKIENSLEIDYPNLEILVASDGSTDGTVEIAQQFDGIVLLPFEGQRGKTALVFDAVSASKGDILCLCDANVMFRPDAVCRMVAHLQEQRVGGVTGDVRLQSEESSFGLAESLFYRLERCIHQGESSWGAVMGVDGGMYVIRRELYPHLQSDTVLDDFSISMNVIRSGKELRYEPTAVADESATEAATDEFRRRIRMGVGIVQVLSRGYIPRWTQPRRMFMFVSHKLLRWLSPWILVGLMASISILSFQYLLARLVLAAGMSLLLLAAVGAIWPRSRKSHLVVMPFYFVLSQVAFAWGMLRGLFCNSTGTWQRTARQKLVKNEQ